MKNLNSFDDIFDLDDIFDDNEEKTAGSVTDEEKNSGLWDTGVKENIWRTGDEKSDPSTVWDPGQTIGSDPTAGGCPSCPDECEECDPAEDEPDENVETSDPGEPAASEPADEPADSGGMFDDIF